MFREEREPSGGQIQDQFMGNLRNAAFS